MQRLTNTQRAYVAQLLSQQSSRFHSKTYKEQASKLSTLAGFTVNPSHIKFIKSGKSKSLSKEPFLPIQNEPLTVEAVTSNVIAALPQASRTKLGIDLIERGLEILKQNQ